MMFGDGSYVVAVIEPEQKARVQWKTAPSGEAVLPSAWADLEARAGQSMMAFQAAVVGYAAFRKEGADRAAAQSVFGSEEGNAAREFWSFLAEQEGEGAFDLALWTLQNHSRPEGRIVAAAVLLNFAARDAAWWVLTDGLRDADDRVKSTCQQVLQIHARDAAREVDWGPGVPALRAVLDGTHIAAVPSLARALVATSIRPELASPLLAGAGHGLLVYAGATRDNLGGPVRDLLARLSGQKHERDVEKWRSWIGSLRPPEK